jgi:hypothetical protein
MGAVVKIAPFVFELTKRQKINIVIKKIYDTTMTYGQRYSARTRITGLGMISAGVENTRKYKLLSIATFTAFSLWAFPAMAQVSGNDEYSPPPAERGFYAPRQFGNDCRRRNPKKCTPEQRDEMNRLITVMCNLGGAAIGGVSGDFVAVATALVLSPVESGTAAGTFGGRCRNLNG